MLINNFALAFRAFLLLVTLCLTSLPVVASPVLTPFNASLIVEGDKATPKPSFYRLQTVIIDAGHGGKDPGGMGPNSQEKHIALAIAQLLANKIKVNYPEINVILTRDDDTFIPLYERAAIANRSKADLFISIHANIMPGSSATFGTETFVMGQHVSEHNLRVAKRENASVLLEADYETNYDYDPTSDEGHILMAMYQSAFLDQSILFASLVEQQFADAAGRKSRGVKQAGFVVLKETAMPSVLVETGFMSNSKEEKYLLSDSGRKELADAIFRAFSTYRNMMEREDVSVATTAGVEMAPVRTYSREQLKRDVQAKSSGGNVVQKEVSVPSGMTRKGVPAAVVTRSQPQVVQVDMPTPGATGTQSVVLAQPAYQAPVAVPVTNKEVRTSVVAIPNPAVAQPAARQESVLTREVAPPPATEVRPAVIPVVYQNNPAIQPATYTPPVYTSAPARLPIQTDDDLIYAVQLIATPRPLARSEEKWNQVTYPIHVAEEGGMYKYQARGINDPAAAINARQQMRVIGFNEAFIVIYRGSERLNAAETKALLQ